MKLYVSFDMEGLAGISSWQQVDEKDRKYARDLVKLHIKWLVEAIKESSKNDEIEEILIADSHASGENIPYDITQMDDRIYLVSGFPRAFYMMPAMDPGYDRVLFIGYHAGSGAVHGVMDHTYSGSVIMSLKINGVAMSECTLNLGYAWNVHGVPMAFVLGDEVLKQQLEKLLKGQYVYVSTKWGLSRHAAKMKPMKLVEREIKDGVKEALELERGKLARYEVEKPIELDITLTRTSYADIAELLPGFKRVDGHRVRFIHDDYAEVFEAIMAMVLTVLGYSKL